MILSVLVSCSSLQRRRSDGQFEGIVKVVEQYGQSSDMAINTTYYVKADHLRMESTRAWKNEILTVTLYDYNLMKMYTLLPEEMIFMEASLPEERDMLSEDEPIDAKQETRLLKAKTGLSKIIHGYSCEQWIFKNNLEGELEMWMAKGFPLLEGALGRKIDYSSGKPTMMSPFMMVIRKVDGKEVMRWEITEIKHKRLNDSIFMPPPDYRKIKRKQKPAAE